jgi:hypothetical protein
LRRRVERRTGARAPPDAAVATPAARDGVRPDVPRPPYFWVDRYGVSIQFAGHADSVTIEAGAADDRDVLAVCRRAGGSVAAHGMNEPRLFTHGRTSSLPPPAS